MATNFPHWLQSQVTKKQVDNFRKGKLTPCCQLTAKVTGKRKKIPQLSHQVKLEGAKYPHDVFTINLPAEGTCQIPTMDSFMHSYSFLSFSDSNSQPTETFGDLGIICTRQTQGLIQEGWIGWLAPPPCTSSSMQRSIRDVHHY